jgi:hypothetical protein
MTVCGAALFAQTKSELQEMYMTYLRAEGYSPSVDSDGDILFKSEGRNYYIIVDDEDLEYFCLLYPNFWEIESESERRTASAAIMDANRTTKVAKAYITSRDDTCVEAGIYLNTPQDFKRHFSRMLDAIQVVRRKFINAMNE